MIEIFPVSGYSLRVEHHQKQVRLVVEKDDYEFVCRKESISVIRKFLTKTNAHIFKGRLQLNKNKSYITVIAKGENILTMDEISFTALLPL